MILLPETHLRLELLALDGVSHVMKGSTCCEYLMRDRWNQGQRQRHKGHQPKSNIEKARNSPKSTIRAEKFLVNGFVQLTALSTTKGLIKLQNHTKIVKKNGF